MNTNPVGLYSPTQVERLDVNYEKQNANFPQDLLEMLLAACLQHVGRWSVPPNWSVGEWHKEAVQVAALAGLEALLEYRAVKGGSFEHCVVQRMTSRVRTCHRREWSYALRYQSTESLSRFGGDSLRAVSEDLVARAGNDHDSIRYEVREAISHLATSQQLVLLELLKGYTETEVGTKLQVSQCAVNKRKQAGLRALREMLRSAA